MRGAQRDSQPVCGTPALSGVKDTSKGCARFGIRIVRNLSFAAVQIRTSLFLFSFSGVATTLARLISSGTTMPFRHRCSTLFLKTLRSARNLLNNFVYVCGSFHGKSMIFRRHRRRCSSVESRSIKIGVFSFNYRTKRDFFPVYGPAKEPFRLSVGTLMVCTLIRLSAGWIVTKRISIEPRSESKILEATSTGMRRSISPNIVYYVHGLRRKSRRGWSGSNVVPYKGQAAT